MVSTVERGRRRIFRGKQSGRIWRRTRTLKTELVKGLPFGRQHAPLCIASNSMHTAQTHSCTGLSELGDTACSRCLTWPSQLGQDSVWVSGGDALRRCRKTCFQELAGIIPNQVSAVMATMASVVRWQMGCACVWNLVFNYSAA